MKNIIKECVKELLTQETQIEQNPSEKSFAHPAVGRKCIVRTFASGVVFGTVVSVTSNEGRSRVTVKNARKLWKFYGGLSLFEISVTGIVQEKSRVTATVEEVFLEDAIEIIPATAVASKSIEEAKNDDAGK